MPRGTAVSSQAAGTGTKNNNNNNNDDDDEKFLRACQEYGDDYYNGREQPFQLNAEMAIAKTNIHGEEGDDLERPGVRPHFTRINLDLSCKASRLIFRA